MTLTRYGWHQWLAITFIIVFIAATVVYFQWWLVLIPLFLLWAALVSFFRNPWRTIPQDLPEGM
ncbi:MAG: hypothetical protein P8N28_06310, partial [Phycisphaerales bacterium]|nr:hypothetical protein [Phycisphaerales bacterium]